ncbi:MAG: hypothetical protein OHK93_000123 [Ramalina farinacea]|uniref:Aminoglycoside phosphotransferase domain-containing protein n=1 Tax=Ramalina farinacea TaxID=258253 RepID=A0AA43QG46_9LECA|nr:hypothetical protein [Ramalina farinacea]
MMGLRYPPLSPPLTPSNTHKAVQDVLSRARLTVIHSEELPNHLHQITLLRLSDGSRLILKTDPPPISALLRSEYTYLHAEATILELLATSSLTIPRILRYERKAHPLDSSFLLTTCLPGVYYSNVEEHLTKVQRKNIDRNIESCSSNLGKYRSHTFGPAGLVKAGRGFKGWKEAFTAMLESVMMDGEDIMVNLPYYQIREAISRWESYLEAVTEARLVVPDLRQKQNILIDRRSAEVTGLLDFGKAFWGDVEMYDQREDGNIKGLLYGLLLSCIDF